MEKIVKGETVYIDKEDESLLHKYNWYIHKIGSYRRLVYDLKGKRLYFHRVLLEITDSNTIVDHINGNPLDNRRNNLRISNKSTNGMNRSKNKNNTTGYKGVVWYPKNKTFSAELMVNKIRYRKGGFKTAKEAAIKYNELAKEHHGEFAKLNEIEDNNEK